jgi:hypothetical protein
MAQIGDAKGEYRGLAYRDEAELRAWLAKRPSEAQLEPDLPIIDPHHQFETRGIAATACGPNRLHGAYRFRVMVSWSPKPPNSSAFGVR